MLDLYHRWGCPYSATVREFIETHGLRSHVEYIDLDENSEAIDRLFDLTGNVQVPCLVIDGRPLLESNDIMEWLSIRLLRGQPENRQPTLAP